MALKTLSLPQKFGSLGDPLLYESLSRIVSAVNTFVDNLETRAFNIETTQEQMVLAAQEIADAGAALTKRVAALEKPVAGPPALSLSTAGGLYAGGEQTMLQEAHDGIRLLLEALRTKGVIA